MTEAEIIVQLAGWHNTLSILQSGQQYTVGGIRNGRTLTRADLPEVRATIDWLEAKLAKATGGGTGIRMRKAIV
jgi:hypothetical protein